MIERLYVNNFRCFENLTIDFAGRPSALVIGKNGSGKSTLLRALQLLHRVSTGANPVKRLITRADFTRLRTDAPMRFEAELMLGGKRHKYTISFEMPDPSRPAEVSEESLSVEGEFAFTRQQTQITLGQGGSTFGLEDKVAALPILSERHGQDPIERVRRFFSEMNVIAPVASELSGFSDGEATVLRANASNFAECLNTLLIRHPAAYTIVIDYLKSHIPDISSFRNAPRGETGHQLVVEFEGSQKGRLSLAFDSLSDGEKCYFLSALLVALNEKVGPVFCMWDEPDNHLSLPEIGHFITQLRRLANREGQFIATSHHPETIRKFSAESTLVFTRRSHLEPTVVRPLDQLEYHGDLIQALVRDEIIG